MAQQSWWVNLLIDKTINFWTRSYSVHNRVPLFNTKTVSLNRYDNICFERKEHGIVVGDEPQLYLKGEVFLYWSLTFAFFHFLQDVIGQYLLVKERVPGLRFVALSGNEYTNSFSDFANDLLRTNGIEDYEIYNVNDFNLIEIESLLFISSNENSFLQTAFHKDIMENVENAHVFDKKTGCGGHPDYQREAMSLVSQNILKHVPEYYRDQKIYLTSTASIKKLHQMKRDVEAIDGYLALATDHGTMPGNDKIAKDLDVDISVVLNIETLRAELEDRYVSSDDEDKIVQKLSSHGFKIIDTGQMPFWDQLRYIRWASVVCCLDGSGAANAAFMENPEASFILLSTQPESIFDNIIRWSTKTPVFIRPQTWSQDSKMSIDEIIETLSRHLETNV